MESFDHPAVRIMVSIGIFPDTALVDAPLVLCGKNTFISITSITLIAGEVNKSSDSTEEVYCVRRNFYVKTENIKRSRVSVTQAQCITLTYC